MSLTFNSLYEIQLIHHVLILILILYFQFSLWDSIVFLTAFPVNILPLSILFMRFITFITTLFPQNQHLSILFMRFTCDFDALIEFIDFQFSLWDSIGKIPTNQIFSIFLSILFMRFKNLLYIHQMLIILSILFMRFPHSVYYYFEGYGHFQFSLWDSGIINNIHSRTPVCFQFSLWDSGDYSFAVSPTVNTLSILFMRFQNQKVLLAKVT